MHIVLQYERLPGDQRRENDTVSVQLIAGSDVPLALQNAAAFQFESCDTSIPKILGSIARYISTNSTLSHVELLGICMILRQLQQRAGASEVAIVSVVIACALTKLVTVSLREFELAKHNIHDAQPWMLDSEGVQQLSGQYIPDRDAESIRELVIASASACSMIRIEYDKILKNIDISHP